ncbi:hypothetical protein F4859DRAFT_477531 [Xylaria cf. heliscus]|nr:hypothetical protein F4859DRAFT_477531 [Xylaria cf. heliscus]
MYNPAVESAKSLASQGLRFAAAGARNATEWAAANLKQATIAGAGAACVVAPMLVAAPVLGLVGFGATGIVGGSIAAGIQSAIGSVVAPSVFATLQSAAAGGYGVAAVSGTVQGLGVLGTSCAGAMSFLNKKEQDDEDADAQGGKERVPDEDADQEHHDSNMDEDDGNLTAKAKI